MDETKNVASNETKAKSVHCDFECIFCVCAVDGSNSELDNAVETCSLAVT